MKGQNHVSPQRGMPVNNKSDSAKVVAVTGETVQLYYDVAGVLTTDTGQVAGTAVVGKLLYKNILNQIGSEQGSYRDSSLSFTSSDLTTEVFVAPEKIHAQDDGTLTNRLAAITESMANGEYCVDYDTGLIYGKKASNGTTLTATAYKVNKSDLTATVDSEFPAAAAITDGFVNPTTTNVMGMNMVWNGASWDRMTPALLGGGGSAGGGNNTYSTEQGDFTATVTNATTNIVLSVDSVGGSTITAANFANAILKVWDASTDEMVKISLDDFTWTAGTKTLAVANCTGAFTFATGDLVSLTLIGPDKMRDTVSDAQKTVEQAPIYTRHIGDTLAALTNIATNTTGYLYLDMSGYRKFAFECDTSGTTPTDTLTLTVEATWQDDGTAQASCTYQDVTNAWFGVASVVDADTTFEKNDDTTARYVRLKYVTSNDSGADADLTVFARRSW